VRAIAHQLHMGRRLVRQYLAAPSFPERAPSRPRRTLPTPYEPYRRRRWDAGCQNAAALWRELRAQGFAGSASFVRQQVRRWRAVSGRPGTPARLPGGSRQDPPAKPPPVRVLSPRQASWLFLREDDKLSTEPGAYRAELLRCCPEIASALPLVAAFQQLVRTRDSPALTAWLATAESCGLREFREFAAGVRRDLAAVEAALTHAWSSGQVEGQITRLKLVKRSMYGRAGCGPNTTARPVPLTDAWLRSGQTPPGRASPKLTKSPFLGLVYTGSRGKQIRPPTNLSAAST
jgi:transposase